MDNRIFTKDIIETITGFPINNPDLYQNAMIHKSFITCPDTKLFELRKFPDSYDGIEFLGDKLYGCIVAEYLYHRFKNAPAGLLTKMYIGMSRSKTLASFTRKLGLNHFAIVGKKENQFACTDLAIGRNNEKIQEDLFEAFIGAMHLDQGPDVTKKFIINLIEEMTDFDQLYQTEQDWKGRLILTCNQLKLTRPQFLPMKRKGFNQNNYAVVMTREEMNGVLNFKQQARIEEHCRDVFEPIEGYEGLETELIIVACGNTKHGTSKAELCQSASEFALSRLILDTK